MNIEEFMDKLKGSFPASQSPGDEGERQYFGYLSDCKYKPKQLDRLLQKVLKTNEYFPSIGQLVRAANELSYHVGTKPPEVHWCCFHVSGKCYARRDGYAIPVGSRDYEDRIQREAIPIAEGKKIAQQAYDEYRGLDTEVEDNQLAFPIIDEWESV